MIDPQTLTHALNRAADDIIDAADLPDTGTRDALNLLVNAAGHYLDHPGASLEDVARDCYDLDEDERDGREPLDVILDWINS